MWIAWNLSCVAGFLAVYGYMVFVETTCRTTSLWSLLLMLLIFLFQVNTAIFSGRVFMKISIRLVLLFSSLAIVWGTFFSPPSHHRSPLNKFLKVIPISLWRISPPKMMNVRPVVMVVTGKVFDDIVSERDGLNIYCSLRKPFAINELRLLVHPAIVQKLSTLEARVF